MKRQWHLGMEFHLSKEPELSRLQFQSPFLDKPIVGVRSTRVRRGETSIRWTPGTISLTLLFIQAKINVLREDTLTPVLQGGAGSPAVALVNAILRYRIWSFDIFGVDNTGRSVLGNLLVIQNQRLRAAGPVKVYLKEGIFSEDSIRVYLDESRLNSVDELVELKLHLLRNFDASPRPIDVALTSRQSFRRRGESPSCAL